VSSRADLERATDGLPVLGEISQVTTWRDREAPHVVSREAPSSPAAEGYRTLRTAIQFLGVERSLKSIQITSSRSDDGKTTTLANLAVAFARLGIKVTIVGCDLRQPRVHEFFGLSNQVGFTSVLLNQASTAEALQKVPGEPNIALLSAGPPPPNPSELLASARARQVIAALEEASDLVLVDSSPILPVTDGILVSGMTEGTLLVASAKSSSRRAMHRTVQVLRQVDAPVIGTVLNRTDPVEGFGGGGYGYAAPGAAGANGAGGSRWLRRRSAPPMALHHPRRVLGS
jgi:capsular exopolysaccharide synthesis family protein